MKLRRLYLKNYGLFKEAVVDIHPGINIVFGVVNGDYSRSNGAGKSLLVGSLLYALSGKSPRMPWQTSFDVKFETEEYLIERIRHSNSTTIRLAIGEKNISGRVSEMNKVFEEVFGSYDVLSSLYFSLEGSQFDFWRMPPSARYTFFSDVFGLDLVSSFKEAARELHKERSIKLSSLMQRKSELETQLHNKEKLLDELNVVELEREIHSLQEKKKQFSAQLEAVKEKLNSLLKLVKERDELLKTYNTLTERRHKVASSIEMVTQQLADLRRELGEVDAKLKKYANADLDTIEEQLLKQKELLSDDLIKIKTQMEMYEQNVDLLKNDICPVCKRPITDELRHELLHQFGSREDLENELVNIKNRLAEIEHKLDKVKKARVNLSLLNSRRTELEQRLKECEAKLVELQHADFSDLESVKSRLAEIEQILSSSDLAQLQSQFSDLSSKLSAVATKLSSYTQKLEMAKMIEQEVSSIKASLEAVISEYTKLSNELPAYERILYYFSSGLVMQRLLRDLVSVIEDVANEFLVYVGSDMRVMFDIEKVLKSGKRKPELHLKIMRGNNVISPSSGEGTILSIALRVAFARIYKKVDFFVFDESFAFLDDMNTNRVIEALFGVIDYGFHSVILVSHKPSLREMSGVHQIIVERSGDESVVYS